VDVTDGRRYLERNRQRHDVIVLDAYYADSIPFHLTTREFLQLVRDRLRPGGVVVANVIGSLEGDGSKLLRSFVRTYREVFPTVELHPVYPNVANPGYIGNVVLVATTAPAADLPALRARWHALRSRRPLAPNLDRVIAARVERELPLDDVPTLVDDYAPTDALLVG